VTCRFKGLQKWSMTRDAEGNREYKAAWLIECDTTDGPANALRAPGLPLPGSAWNFFGDSDLWAYCRQDATVTPLLEKDKNKQFVVEQTFSTKPTKKCGDNQVEDPLLEPQKVSGTYKTYQVEATFDRRGERVVNSAWEQFRGPQVEFDEARATVKIDQNVANLQLDLLAELKNTVNALPLWGLPARCIKFLPASWEKKYHGQCQVYYTRSLEFDVLVNRDPETGELVSGFDRDILDEGTKVLHGKWANSVGTATGATAWVLLNIDGAPPDEDNPQHFDRFTDRQGNTCRVILNGFGLPAGVTVGTGTGTFNAGDPGFVNIEYYHESNFLLLGIPTVL
jgi:hypothetical protein